MGLVAVSDDCPLTPAELRVLALLMEGLTYEQIAVAVSRSQSTVRTQLHNAYRRLGVTTSYQAVLECVRSGWLTWGDADPHQATLMRIEELFRRLVTAVESRHASASLTPRQRGYLEAFERYMQSATREQRLVTRHTMNEALATMFDESRVAGSSGRRSREVIAELGLFAEAGPEAVAA